MFNTAQVHRFCNLVMASEGAKYIRKTNKGKDLDAHKLANQFIFQHAMEDTGVFDSVLQSVYEWWGRYVEKDKWLKLK